MYESILSNIQKYVSLTESEQSQLCEILQYKTYEKKKILLREGEICKFEYYIVKGCMRTFYVNESGVEVTIQFGLEDWWVSDVCSFSEQSPSRLFVECLEDCEVLMLTPTTKETLLKTIPKLERYFRLLVQKHMNALQNRLINTISMSATARYLEFISTYPTVQFRVPQYYIASYLGVSAEFVSKIRKRLAE
ncbi:MAG: Crp/Fnr family transcriptional regulator [Pseudopedobacter saltans]|uniref:Crp/Fnr family transcriptional regulator n=1 Tax=Pseudopedobacter saltans TaxID=151895 RepID=A0A2W5H917_9SPHI|nr:MAG: Crp/Fnr family transcriptional regulator [Pseudopedobacter saltans]